MPRVVDMRGYEARALLESLGLTVEVVRIQTGNPNQVGYVIAQDPRSQSVVVQGSTVTIFVGAEPAGDGNGNGNGDGGDG
jgi:beta-lactam-binding protein with PASTA domain